SLSSCRGLFWAVAAEAETSSRAAERTRRIGHHDGDGRGEELTALHRERQTVLRSAAFRTQMLAICKPRPLGAIPMTLSRSTALACFLCFVAGAGAMWAQQQVQRTSRREAQFENDQVSVWKSIIMPK